jgi:predicted GNAT family N-acyltransferase
MPLEFRQVPHRSYEYEEAVQLRRDVLRLPLGLDFTPDELNAEAEHLHLVGIDENKVVACLVLEPKTPKTIKMRQVAVSPERQGEGIGAELVRFSEQVAQANAYGEITLNARANVVPFYLKLGYEIYGEPFEEVTIPHQSMKKILSDKAK